MADEDRRRWDEKHAAAIASDAAAAAEAAAIAAGTAGAAGAAGAAPIRSSAEGAPPFLAAVDPLLPRCGRALDVACGRGGATIALAHRGFSVFAVDVSLVALTEVRRRAEVAGVTRAVHTLVHDLDAGLPPDLGTFDLVLCSHFHAPALWPAFRAALAPGGVLAMDTLTSRNVELGLAAPSPRFLIAPGEILGAAEGLDVLLHAEDVIDGAHRARLVARLGLGPASSGTLDEGRDVCSSVRSGPRGGPDIDRAEAAVSRHSLKRRSTSCSPARSVALPCSTFPDDVCTTRASTR